MYKYLINSHSGSVIDENLKKTLIESLKKNHIYSNFINFSSEKELAVILSSFKPQNTNTLVIIGDDSDFNILIGQAGKLREEIAIGYLPISKSRIAKKLKINNWQSAIEALTQRRISKKTIYSISSRYFYDEIKLNLKADSNKVLVQAGKKLELSIPVCNLRFENLNEDHYFSNSPIQLVASRYEEFKENDSKSSFKDLIYKKLQSNGHRKKPEEIILSMHSKIFKITTQEHPTDELNRKYNSVLTIGKSAKIVRIISKKPEINSN